MCERGNEVHHKVSQHAHFDVSSRCLCHHGTGFLHPSLLLLLAVKSSYGYELLSRLKEVGYGEWVPDAATIYKALRRLEREGMVKSEWDTSGSGPARRVYSITAEGAEMLRLWAASIARTKQMLEKFLEKFDAEFGS